MSKILLIYTKKDTGKYHIFEICTLTENLTRENLLERVEKYNNDNEKETTIKVYEDDLLISLIDDAKSSMQIRHLISNLKSICSDIEDSVDSLTSWTETIDDMLSDLKDDV